MSGSERLVALMASVEQSMVLGRERRVSYRDINNTGLILFANKRKLIEKSSKK
ncbi:MAG: hypothetical protein MHPSP_004149, partial [Paramarteilia canceri]